MKVIRVLVYEGEEVEVMKNLAMRGIRGSVTHGGIAFSEAFFAEREGMSALYVIGEEAFISSEETTALRAQVDALPVPDWVKRARQFQPAADLDPRGLVRISCVGCGQYFLHARPMPGVPYCPTCVEKLGVDRA